MSTTVTTLYADVDGTLVGPLGNLLWDADRKPSLAAADSLVRAAEAGLEIVALSGRDRRRVADFMRVLGLTTGIAELGGVRLYERGLEIAIERGACPFDGRPAEALRGAVDGLAGAFPRQLEEHTPWNELREVSLMLRGDVPVDEVQGWLDQHGYEWAVFAENGISSRTFASLPGIERPRIFHVAPRGVSKRAGIEADQRARDLDPAACAVVGDAPADLDCATAVSRCFVVRNGVEHVTGLEAAVTATPNAEVTNGRYGEGFAEAVMALLS